MSEQYSRAFEITLHGNKMDNETKRLTTDAVKVEELEDGIASMSIPEKPSTEAEWESYSLKRISASDACPARIELRHRDKSTPSATRSYSACEASHAIGFLLRDSSLRPVAAMSGYKNAGQPTFITKDWVDKALELAKIVGYCFPPTTIDGAVPGHFHACHVEPQLITYFIHHHVTLLEKLRSAEDMFEIELMTKLVSLEIEHMAEVQHYNSTSTPEFCSKKREKAKNLRDLQRIQETHDQFVATADPLNRATILVSSQCPNICEGCESFRDQVVRYFKRFFDLDLSIVLAERSEQYS